MLEDIRGGELHYRCPTRIGRLGGARSGTYSRTQVQGPEVEASLGMKSVFGSSTVRPPGRGPSTRPRTTRSAPDLGLVLLQVRYPEYCPTAGLSRARRDCSALLA